MKKTYFNWSSGKDAAMALHALQQGGEHDVEKLVTSVNAHHDRVSMHGLHRALLEAQAAAIGIPLHTIELPEQPDMDTYNEVMVKTVTQLKNEGYTDCAFGDIFLEDLRQYREEQLKPYGINAHFPIWKKDTKVLLHHFIDSGFKAVVVCVNAQKLDESFVGRELDDFFLNDLPQDVDPCGENGEFHTFCYDGPIFNTPVNISLGEKVYREYDAPESNDANKNGKVGFWFQDVLPG